jgi:hypothetical protein
LKRVHPSCPISLIQQREVSNNTLIVGIATVLNKMI